MSTPRSTVSANHGHSRLALPSARDDPSTKIAGVDIRGHWRNDVVGADWMGWILALDTELIVRWVGGPAMRFNPPSLFHS